MDELQRELFEKQLVSISKGLDYPRTPNIAGSVMIRLSAKGKGMKGEGGRRFMSRRLAWSLTVILILFSSLMLIPPARAAILEFIQIGIVRIFRAEPTPIAPPQQEFPSTMIPMTATLAETLETMIPLLERMAGEVTLEEAQQTVNYSILLPSYPPDLGLPDRVFVQDAEGDMTILVWIDPQQPSQVLMSLHMIPPGSWAVDKMDPARIEETTVNGQRAIWAVGPYPLRFSNGNLDFVRLVDGHVLIWTDGEVTYRLETELELEEAIKVAESLEPAR
jgi:hypothetical protein